MKFRLKMTLCMLGLLSLLFGIGGSLLISASFASSLEREKDVAWYSYRIALSTLQIVGDLDGPRDYHDLADTLEQLSGQNPSSWAALRLSGGGGVIYETGAAATAIDSGGERPKPGECLFRSAPDAAGARRLVLSGALEAGGETLYLDTVHDVSFLYETRRAQQQAFRWVFCAMALVCAALAYTVSRVLTAPLEGLSRASRAIASGQLSSRVKVRSRDEIGAVSADFNAMADRLEETIDQLRCAMERREQFMGSFAHELKTPLTSVIGYADLLRGDKLDGAERAEAAGYIVSEGRRLERLSRKLLELLVLKNSALPLCAACPAELVETLAEQLRPVYLAQGVELLCQCQKGECLLERDLVHSLVLNLLDNARKAMAGGGTITVSVEMLPDGCRICVRDEGRGIPEEALELLTQAFYRVDRSRSREQGGVGLGLTLCQAIVELHGGALCFENLPDGGACVTAELRGGRPCAERGI